MKELVNYYDWVIYLGQEWESFFKRHLICELARQLPRSRILCVARPMCLLTGPLRRSKEFLAWLKKPEQVTALDKNLLHVRPGVLLHDHLAGHIPGASRINRYWLKRQLRVAVQQAGLRWRHLIALIYDPFQLEYLGLVGESLSIYDCYDEYSVQSEVPFLRSKSQVLEREQAILKQVDLTFVVSETIRNRIKKMHDRVYLVPNGVETQHFGRAADRVVDVMPDVAGIPQPVVGFLGNITSRIDFELLRHLATSRPEWSVLLVGGVSERGLSIPISIARLPNVHFLGARPYGNLPNYLQTFDVCIIPYVADDPFNINCSPLKLYEYLATGKPIVSTDLPAVRPFDGLVRIAKDPEEFERQLMLALGDQDRDLRQRRLAAARENSWEQRAESILEILASVLPESGLKR